MKSHARRKRARRTALWIGGDRGRGVRGLHRPGRDVEVSALAGNTRKPTRGLAEDGGGGDRRVRLHLLRWSRCTASPARRCSASAWSAPPPKAWPWRRPRRSERVITVQFDGGVNSKLPWEFSPGPADDAGAPGRAVRGDLHRAQHQPRAPSSAAPCRRSRRRARRATSARPNASASPRRRCRPAKTRAMPVRFIVDPNLPADVKTITLVVYLLQERRADRAAGRHAPRRPRSRAVVAANPELRNRNT